MATETAPEEADGDPLDRTWDGLPIARDLPRGAAVVVRRRPDGVDRAFEYLLLHRAQRGPHYEGDWAWTPPSGARQPGEPLFPSALRELQEEAGLVDVDVAAVDISSDWALYLTEVAGDNVVLSDPEHDRYQWTSFEDAMRRCAPETVRENLRRAEALPSVTVSFTREAGPGPALRHNLRVDGKEHGVFEHFPGGIDGERAGSSDLRWSVSPSVRAVPWLLTRALWCYARDVLARHQPTVARVFGDFGSPSDARSAETAGFVADASGYASHVLDMARVFGG